jgi:hypothetical protein
MMKEDNRSLVMQKFKNIPILFQHAIDPKLQYSLLF